MPLALARRGGGPGRALAAHHGRLRGPAPGHDRGGAGPRPGRRAHARHRPGPAGRGGLGALRPARGHARLQPGLRHRAAARRRGRRPRARPDAHRADRSTRPRPTAWAWSPAWCPTAPSSAAPALAHEVARSPRGGLAATKAITAALRAGRPGTEPRAYGALRAAPGGAGAHRRLPGSTPPDALEKKGTLMASTLPLLYTHVMGSHGFPSWFWTALDKIKAGEYGQTDVRETFDDATQLAIRDQERAGIDVVCDGEMRRYFFVQTFYGHMEGLETARAAAQDRPLRLRQRAALPRDPEGHGAEGPRHGGRVQVPGDPDRPAGEGHLPRARSRSPSTSRPGPATPTTATGSPSAGTWCPR